MIFNSIDDLTDFLCSLRTKLRNKMISVNEFIEKWDETVALNKSVLDSVKNI